MPLPLAPDNPAAPPAPTPADLPPPFSGIASGEIAAVALPPEKADKPPGALGQFVQANLPAIVASGIDFFETKDLHSVFFNPARISLEDLKKADRKGKILEVALPIPEPAEEKPKKAATLTVHEKTPLAPAEGAPPAGPLANQQVPMNPVPKPSGRIQAARLQALKTPNSDQPGNGPVDQLSKRAL